MLSSGFLPPPNAVFSFSRHSDHGEDGTSNVDLFAHGVMNAEEFLRGVMTQESDLGRSFHVAIGKETAFENI